MEDSPNPEPQSAPRATTADALLGILSLRAMTGYEIRQTIQRSIGNFWSESFGQIYPALKRLEAEGAITATEKPGANGTRSGTLYSLTALGHERLRAWLAQPAQPQVQRNELLLKLFFGLHTAPGIPEQHVRGAQTRAAERLQHYRAIVRDLKVRYPEHPGLPYWLITARFGIAEAKATLRWAEETLAALADQPRKRSSATKRRTAQTH